MVLHAGMGKAGSTSIQTWLSQNAALLRDEGVALLVPRPAGVAGRGYLLDLQEYRSGPLVANKIVDSYRSEEGAAVLSRLVDQLDAAASRHRVTVVSGEALQVLFWQLDERFIDRLDDLAETHAVRVAYYVRPQHTALEAHWRQWGFRSGLSPARFVAGRADALRYVDTLHGVRRLAPRVSFEPRPFRHDLLEHGGPAPDFARWFLESGVPADEVPVWSNPGLPLDVANALRPAPEGLFWESIRDNRGMNQVKRLLAGTEIPDSDRARRSRALLHSYCLRVFEPGNARLIQELGWETRSFVPPLEGPDSDAGQDPEAQLRALDELWKPSASDGELALLYMALAAAFRRRPGGRPPRRDPPARGPAGERESPRLPADPAPPRPARSALGSRLIRRVRALVSRLR